MYALCSLPLSLRRSQSGHFRRPAEWAARRVTERRLDASLRRTVWARADVRVLRMLHPVRLKGVGSAVAEIDRALDGYRQSRSLLGHDVGSVPGGWRASYGVTGE
jgi:hypothetical protein